MFEEYLKHLRQEPIDHRLTVKTECGVRAVILLTTDKIDRADCIPCLQTVGSSPNPKHQNPSRRRQRNPEYQTQWRKPSAKNT